jgi:hypothetical protein
MKDTTGSVTDERLRSTYAINVRQVAIGWEFNAGLLSSS